MKTQIETYYLHKEDSPLKEDRLLTDHDGDAWLEPELYTTISDDGETLVIEVDIPETPCRFLGHADGSPPACYGFGSPAATGNPVYMEDAPDGFAPELVCLHCAEYTFEREERKRPRTSLPNFYGAADLLPELSAEEAGGEGAGFHYIDTTTGEIA